MTIGHGFQADVWSVGVLICELITGYASSLINFQDLHLSMIAIVSSSMIEFLLASRITAPWFKIQWLKIFYHAFSSQIPISVSLLMTLKSTSFSEYVSILLNFRLLIGSLHSKGNVYHHINHSLMVLPTLNTFSNVKNNQIKARIRLKRCWICQVSAITALIAGLK